MPTPTIDNLLSTVREFRKTASLKPDATDPTERGTVSTEPAADGDNKDKQSLPADQKNGPAKPTLENESAQVAGSGDGAVPQTEDGKKKEDAATDPETTIEKIARLTRIAKGFANPAPTPAATPATPAVPATPESTKQAGNDGLDEITTNTLFLAKVASIILSTDHGARTANELIRDAAGVEAARELLEKAATATEFFATLQQEEMAKAASANAQQQAIADEFAQLPPEAQAFYKEAHYAAQLAFRAIDKEYMVKSAAATTDEERQQLAEEIQLEKMALAQGMTDGEAMAAAEAGGGMPEMPEGGAEGGPAAALDPATLAQLIQEAVAQGAISEQDAAQLMAALQAETPTEEGSPDAAVEEAMSLADA